MNRYVQRPPQYNVPQQWNGYRAPPQQYQPQYQPQYMPQQAQQQYMPQPQGFMPQAQQMPVPKVPCNCGKKGQKTKAIVSGGKKVKVVVKKNGKATATVTAAKGSKVKNSKASKAVAKKKKAKLGVFAKMEKESSERKVIKGETVSIEAQLATSKSTKRQKKELAKPKKKKSSKKSKSKKKSSKKSKSKKPARSTMMIPYYPNKQAVFPGARYLAQPGMVPMVQYQMPVQRIIRQQMNRV